MTGLAEIFVAVRVKDVRTAEIAESAAHENVGRKVIASGEAGGGDGECGSVREDLYPTLRIFVRDDTGHGPHEHGMPSRKGCIDASLLPEAPVARAAIGAFASGDDLHWRVNQKCVGEGFEREVTGFLGVRIVGADAVQPDQAGAGASPD